MIIVYEGQLELAMSTQDTTYKFELLSAGSSFGQYSLLKTNDNRVGVGTSMF